MSADLLFLMGEKGLCEPGTLKALQALKDAESSGAAVQGSVLKRMVDALVAEEQAVAEIRRCLQAIRLPDASSSV